MRFCFGISWAFLALMSLPIQALSSVDVCESLERPNIDCACVANRLAVFESVSPTPAAKSLIKQGYLHALGQPNSFAEDSQTLMQDPISMMKLVEAYDAVGGRPENVEEYEEGCVIAGAAKKALSPIANNPTMQAYQNSCVAATGKPRYCQCIGGQLSAAVTPLEFEAYYRSFADYSNKEATTLDSMAAARGDAMGISGADFLALNARARRKIDAVQEQSEAYCAAILWADQSAGFDAQQRQNAGFEAGLTKTLDQNSPSGAPANDTSVLESDSPLEQARAIAKRSCREEGNSQQYCDCYMEDINSQVIPLAPRPEVALAWVVMNSPAGLSSSEQVTLLQSIPPSDHQAAAMMLMQTMGVGERCGR